MSIAIPGLREFRNELRRAEGDAPKLLQKENKAFAQRLVPEVQSEYRRHFPRPTTKERRRSRRRSSRTVDNVRARATQTTAGIAIGGARVPHMLGQEFGSDRYAQFAPWTGPAPGGRGSRGRFLFPVIREEAPKLVESYGEAVSAAFAAAYPERRA